MASIHAGGAAPGRSAYAAARAAVVQLTAVSAVELAPQGETLRADGGRLRRSEVELPDAFTT